MRKLNRGNASGMTVEIQSLVKNLITAGWKVRISDVGKRYKNIARMLEQKETPANLGLGILCLFFLSGCSGFSSDFSCPKSPAGVCQPALKTYKEESAVRTSAQLQTFAPAPGETNGRTAGPGADPLGPEAVPIKRPEKHLRMLVGPWVDAAGAWHQGERVIFKVEDSRWLVGGVRK